MSNPVWKKEVEKKYQLNDKQQLNLVKKKLREKNFKLISKALQRDWVPDFAGKKMKLADLVLRIRVLSYQEGKGPNWLITLKKLSVKKGIHSNLELEASSEQENDLKRLEQVIEDEFGVNIDLKKLANLDYDYAKSKGLTEHRMLIEKIREDYLSKDVLVSLDQLPEPIGYFVSIESDDAAKVLYCEELLGLDDIPAINMNYGTLVKSLNGGTQRELIFKK